MTYQLPLAPEPEECPPPDELLDEDDEELSSSRGITRVLLAAWPH